MSELSAEYMRNMYNPNNLESLNRLKLIQADKERAIELKKQQAAKEAAQAQKREATSKTK